jgi:hypothetical protein
MTLVQYQSKKNPLYFLSKKNKIKYFNLRNDCTLIKIKFIIGLLHQLEHLKIGMKHEQLLPAIEELLYRHNHMPHLFYLCITEKSVTCFKKLNIMIEQNKLLEYYFIKLINRNIYLWW